MRSKVRCLAAISELAAIFQETCRQYNTAMVSFKCLKKTFIDNTCCLSFRNTQALLRNKWSTTLQFLMAFGRRRQLELIWQKITHILRHYSCTLSCFLLNFRSYGSLENQNFLELMPIAKNWPERKTVTPTSNSSKEQHNWIHHHHPPLPTVSFCCSITA